MARSIINELKEFVNEQTRGVGPVANLEGVIVATATVDSATPQTQQWFVAEVPASALPDYNHLLAAFTYERPGALSLDADATGAVMYPTSGAALPDGHAVFFTGTARLPNKRSLVLRVRGEGASLAVFVDGAQVATDVDTLTTTLDLTAGDHQVLVAAFGGTKPITVESSSDVAIARVETVPRAPIWMKFPTVFTIEPDKGTSLVRMSWVNDPLAASWNLYRIDTSLLGAVVGTPVLNGDGTMTLVVAGLLTSLVVGSFLSTPYFDIGTVATITVGATNTTLVVNLVTVTETVLANWTGVNVYLAGAMTALASVSNAGASVVQYDDSKAKRNSLYIYKVTAVGAFGNTESNFSLPYSIWTNDDEPPAGIDSVSAPLITQDGYLVTVKYQSPVDPDFAGVRVYGPYALSGGNLSAPAAFLPANAVASQPGAPGRWETVQFKADPAQPNMGYYFATYDQMGNEQKPAAFTVRRTGTARAAAFGYKYTGPVVPDWTLNPATILAGVDSADGRNTATVTVLTLKVYPAAATLAVYLDAVLLTSSTQSLNGRTYPAVTLKNTFSDRKEYEVVLTRIQGVPQTLIAGASGTGLQPTSVTYKLDEDKNPGGQVTVDDFKAQPVFNLSYDENVKTIVVKRSGVTKTTLNRTTGLVATGKGTASFTIAGGDAIASNATDAGWTVEYTANGTAVVMWSGSLHGVNPPPPRFDYISAVVDTAATPSYDLACKIIDPSGLGGTLSVWLNPTGATAATPTAAADGTLTIAAVNMPFTATSATVFTSPASTLLNNVKASFTTPKTVYFEYVNSAGVSTGKVEFQISGDIGTVLNADGTLKPIGASTLASTIRPVAVIATKPATVTGYFTGDVIFAQDTKTLWKNNGTTWVAVTDADNANVNSQTFGMIAAAAANFSSVVTGYLTARAIDAGKINVTQLSDFKVLQFSGKVSAAALSSASTVTVTTNAGASPGWTVNQWAAAKLTIADAFGVPVGEYTVVSNTANTVTVTGSFGVALTTAMTFGLSNGAGLGIFVGGRLNSVTTDGSGNPSAYLDLNATTTNPLLYSTAFQLNADGTATYSGNVITNSLSTDQLSTTNAAVSGLLTASALRASTFTMLDSNVNLKIATAVTAGATSATMKDAAGNTPNWGTDQLAGSSLLIAGITYPVIGNTATAITISGTFPTLAVDTVVTLKNSFNGVWGTYTSAPSGATSQIDSTWNTATSSVSRSTTGTTTATTSANNVISGTIASISGQYTIVFSMTLDTSLVQAQGLTAFSEVTVDLIADVFAKVNSGTPQYLYSETIEHYISSDVGNGTVTGVSETQTFPHTVSIPGVTTGLEIIVTPRIVYTRNGRGTGNASGSATGTNVSWQTGGTAGQTRRTLRLFTRHADGFSPAMVIEPIPSIPTGLGRAGDIINVAGNLYVHSGAGWVIAGQGAIPSSTPWSQITGTPTDLAGYGISNAYTKTQSDANYPTKAGSGATGTWGISISGTAAAVPGTGITGGTLASSVLASSLTSLGTLTGVTLVNAGTLFFKDSAGTAQSILTMTNTNVIRVGDFTTSFALQLGGVSVTVSGPLTATLAAGAQPNITGVGPLANLTVSGAIAANGGITVAAGQAIFVPGNAAGAILARNAANSAYLDLIYQDASDRPTIPRQLVATLFTPTQPNITSLGTLTGLISSGALQSSQPGAGSGQTAPSWRLEHLGASPVVSRLVFGTDNSGWQFAIASSNSGIVTTRLTVSDAGVVTAASVVTTADLKVGVQLWVAGTVALSNSGGTTGYYQVYDPSGGVAMLLGGTTDPGNYYTNTTHTFRNRAASSVYAVLTATAAQFNVPTYAIADGPAFTVRAVSSGAQLYMVFQTSTATRRGYIGYGAASSPNLYINNDEAGPIIFQPNGGSPVVSFSTTAVSLGARVDLTGGYLNLNRSVLTTGGAAIQFYSPSFTSWQMYMAPATATSQGALGNLTAPTGSHVNDWALRSLVQASAGYGWTWEAGATSGSYTPSLVMELTSTASSSGSPMLKMWGDMTTRRNSTTGVLYFGDQAAYIYFFSGAFDFSGKPLGNIGALTMAGTLNVTGAGSFSGAVQASSYTDGLGNEIPAIIVSSVAPSTQTANDGTIWIVV